MILLLLTKKVKTIKEKDKKRALNRKLSKNMN